MFLCKMLTECIKTIIPVTPAATPQVVNTIPIQVINQFVQPTTLVTTTSTTTDRVEISQWHDLVQTGDRETPMAPHTVRLVP